MLEVGKVLYGSDNYKPTAAKVFFDFQQLKEVSLLEVETQKDSQLFTSLQYRGKELVENMQLFVYNMNFEE